MRYGRQGDVLGQSRIVIAEDHPRLLEQLCSLLADDFDVVKAVGDGGELVMAVLALQPDLVIADISLPEMSGIDAALAIRSRKPDQKIIFLTNHLDEAMVSAAFHAGASGFVSKPHAAEELKPAVAAALAGRRFVSPTVRSRASQSPG